MHFASSSFPLHFPAYGVSSFQFPVSSFQLPVSSFQLPASVFSFIFQLMGYPVSSFQFPAPSSQLPVSSLQFSASSSHLPVFSFQLPASSFRHCRAGLGIYNTLTSRIGEREITISERMSYTLRYSCGSVSA